MTSSKLLLGYDFDAWYAYEERIPIMTEISLKMNCHSAIVGMSGSGKTKFTLQYIARLWLLHASMGEEAIFYLADYKNEDEYNFLRNCKKYYSYGKTEEVLDEVYAILQRRQLGEDASRTPVYLFFEEYLSNLLMLKERDKKKADKMMRQVAEILSIGRSMGCIIIIIAQTLYASLFTEGSRLNFGTIVILGSKNKILYDMLLPKDFIADIGERKFKAGEGVVLLQGSEMHCIKVPMIKNEEKMQEICVNALS